MGETRDIAENDCIAFRGREIYDSGHEGWNEIHAVMRIMKLEMNAPSSLRSDQVIISRLQEADDRGHIPSK